MGKSNLDHYKEQFAKVKEYVEREGKMPWQKPWESGFLRPHSVATGKPYHGGNVFWLTLAGFDSPWWLTYNRAKKLGGHVKKGESSSKVYHWNFIKKEKEVERPDGNGGTETEVVEETIPLVKSFSVFNIEQCELPEDWREQAGVPDPREDAEGVDPQECAESVVEGMPNKPRIVRDGESSRAYYSPGEDKVRVPDMSQFSDVARYYGTLFHELAHATGHENRLNRAELVSGDVRGSEDYSREELVAEMASAFLVGDCGLQSEEALEQSAVYIETWMERLEESPGLLMSAAGRAEKAARYIRGEYEPDSDNEQE